MFPHTRPVGATPMKYILAKPLPTFDALFLWWTTEAKRARNVRRPPRHVRIR